MSNTVIAQEQYPSGTAAPQGVSPAPAGIGPSRQEDLDFTSHSR